MSLNILSQYLPAIFVNHARGGGQLESLECIERVKDFYRRLWPRNSSYSARLMRLGGDFDGGYLMPANLDGVEWCFSPGSAGRAAFENDLFRLFGIQSFVCDDWSETPENNGSIAGFKKCLIGYDPNQSGTMTLNQWVLDSLAARPAVGSLLLQMDIEGGEYQFLVNESTENLSLFKYIIIEFHYLYLLHNPVASRIIHAAFDKIYESHIPVHAHPNDHTIYGSIEDMPMAHCLGITFELRSQGCQYTCVEDALMPHPLDQPNIKGNQVIAFPKFGEKSVTFFG